MRRIAESYRPPELRRPLARRSARASTRGSGGARRPAVDRGRRDRCSRASVLVLAAGSPPAPRRRPTLPTEAALLALGAAEESEDEALPADYQAIEDLLLEGEGV